MRQEATKREGNEVNEMRGKGDKDRCGSHGGVAKSGGPPRKATLKNTQDESNHAEKYKSYGAALAHIF